MQPDLQNQIDQLKRDLSDLVNETYANNFSASQDFNKYSRFNSRIRVPNLAATPTTCEVGEMCCVSGKLRVCSAANTWTIVGTQT